METIVPVSILHAAIGPGGAVGRRFRGEVAPFPVVDDGHAALAAITLDALAQGAFVLTAECRLTYANRAARSILATAGTLRLCGDRVKATGPDADGSFARMVSATATFGNTNAMSIRTAHGSRLTLTTKPLRGTGAVLMLAAEIDRSERQSASQLKSAFGLTPAEADIARALGTGASPADIACARGALLSTVQSQIKAIASKLGCRRQSEITAIVQTIPRFLED